MGSVRCDYGAVLVLLDVDGYIYVVRLHRLYGIERDAAPNQSPCAKVSHILVDDLMCDMFVILVGLWQKTRKTRHTQSVYPTLVALSSRVVLAERTIELYMMCLVVNQDLLYISRHNIVGSQRASLLCAQPAEQHPSRFSAIYLFSPGRQQFNVNARGPS